MVDEKNSDVTNNQQNNVANLISSKLNGAKYSILDGTVYVKYNNYTYKVYAPDKIDSDTSFMISFYEGEAYTKDNIDENTVLIVPVIPEGNIMAGEKIILGANDIIDSFKSTYNSNSGVVISSFSAGGREAVEASFNLLKKGEDVKCVVFEQAQATPVSNYFTDEELSSNPLEGFSLVSFSRKNYYTQEIINGYGTMTEQGAKVVLVEIPAATSHSNLKTYISKIDTSSWSNGNVDLSVLEDVDFDVDLYYIKSYRNENGKLVTEKIQFNSIYEAEAYYGNVNGKTYMTDKIKCENEALGSMLNRLRSLANGSNIDSVSVSSVSSSTVIPSIEPELLNNLKSIGVQLLNDFVLDLTRIGQAGENINETDLSDSKVFESFLNSGVESGKDGDINE